VILTSKILDLAGTNVTYEKRRNSDINFNIAVQTSIYAYQSDPVGWMEVINADSKRLIKDAFIPLDLAWSIHTLHGCFIISWEHWGKEIDQKATVLK
jgi:hypothetical protein